MNIQMLDNLEYVFIFDYYDIPLFFFSKDKNDGKYYVFYLIDDNAYFYSSLSASDINYFFANSNGYDFLDYLNNKSKLKFILLEGNTCYIKELSEYKMIFNEDFKEAFPLGRHEIKYEYIHKVDFLEIKNNYKKYFPNIYDTEQLTLRIKDKKNSHSLDINIIYSTLDFIKNSWADINDRYANFGAEKKLLMTAPTRGSLKLEFRLESFEANSLFPNKASFSELVDFIDNLSFTPIYSEEEMMNEKNLIEETSKFYEIIDKNNLSIDFISNNVKLSNIKKSEHIKRNLENMRFCVNKEIMKKNVTTENIEIEGEVLSANIKRNHFRIKSVSLGEIYGTFETELFKRLKSSEISVTVSKYIYAHVIKEEIVNIDSNETITKYILTSFNQ